jgi:glutaredoxin 2
MRRLYVKDGCPYSSKVLAFMAEANVLRDFSLELDTPENRKIIKKSCGKATFPALEISPGELMAESNDIIDALADEYEINPNSLKAYQFIFGSPGSTKNTMFKTYRKV